MCGRGWGRVVRWFTYLTVVLLVSGSSPIWAQSTTGTVAGTVKDPNGAAVARAAVKTSNTGTNAARSTFTNEAGSFQFPNLDVGTYQIDITAVGFEELEFAPFDLGARETKRADADLRIASQTTTIDVESTVGAIVQTDTSSIAETKGARELVDLPVATCNG